MIYFAQRSVDRAIKIGFTGQIKERLYGLKRQCGEPPQILGMMRGQRKEEFKLHRQFDHLALGGEWFKPGSDLLSFVNANTFTVERALRIEQEEAEAQLPRVEQCYRIQEVAQKFNVTAVMVKEWVKNGTLRALKIPSTKIVRIPASALAELGFSVKESADDPGA
jgi:hypothetical protein